MAVMAALGTTAPVGSVTCPMMERRNSCPHRAAQRRACKRKTASGSPSGTRRAFARCPRRVVRKFSHDLCGKVPAVVAHLRVGFMPTSRGSESLGRKGQAAVQLARATVSAHKDHGRTFERLYA